MLGSQPELGVMMQGRSTHNRFAGVGSLSILALTLYACGAESGVSPEDPEPEQHQVDAGGATLSAQGGNVLLTVPPGAVPAATTITVTPVSEEPADPDLVPGTMYDFGPDGLQFSEPVTLRLAYDPTAIPAQASAAELRIFKRSGTDWLPTANGSADVAAATVTGEINGFSQFAVVVAQFQMLAVSTTSLPNGVENVDYWVVNGTPTLPHLTATGGDGANVWTVVQGEMPTGLSLQRDGIIVGTPTVVGTENLTIEVANGVDQTALRTFSITVNPRPVLAPSELCTDYPGYAVASFEDATLEAAVRSRMLLAVDDEITCARASTFSALESNNSGITSVVGMQNMPSMLYLDLSFNAISDISPLSGMVSLLSLELESNLIADVGPLSELTALTFQLDLADNMITDVSALGRLTNLEVLALQNNSITHVGSWGFLTAMVFLNLNDNGVTDVTGLGGLTGLLTLLLNNNSITEVTALGGLTALLLLELNNNSIYDANGLWGLTNLLTLRLNDNSIYRIDRLDELTSLVDLQLENNRISTISWDVVSSGLRSLVKLNLAGNDMAGMPFDSTSIIPYATPLGGLFILSSLQDLSLRGTPVGINEPVLPFEPLLTSQGIGAGDRIDLFDTGVSCSVVSLLEDRGVVVSHNC